jgi:hypothetical protein
MAVDRRPDMQDRDLAAATYSQQGGRTGDQKRRRRTESGGGKIVTLKIDHQ